MRNCTGRPSVNFGQLMSGDRCAVEDTEPLFAKPLTADAVHAKYGGVRGRSEVAGDLFGFTRSSRN